MRASILITGAVVVSASAALLYWAGQSHHPASTNPISESALNSPQQHTTQTKQNTTEAPFATLGDVWIDEQPSQTETASTSPSPYYDGNGPVQAHHLHRPTIESALKEIKLDENGDVLVGQDALHSLRRAFEHGDIVLDNDAMNTLMDIIHESLPPEVAQQTAKIVKDFHDYSIALHQRAKEWGRPQNIEERIQLLDEQVELQQLFMGEETAGLLFSVENDSTRQMLEGMNIAVNDTLSREEKDEKLNKLFERYAQATPKIMNWDSRYDQFLSEKQAILNAGLTEEEKELQLQALYQHSFSASERALLVNRDLNRI